jgi:hypothetical protein
VGLGGDDKQEAVRKARSALELYRVIGCVQFTRFGATMLKSAVSMPTARLAVNMLECAVSMLRLQQHAQ